MNDLVDQFEALLKEFQEADNAYNSTDRPDGAWGDLTAAAMELCFFLVDNGPTVTFDAPAEPSAAATALTLEEAELLHALRNGVEVHDGMLTWGMFEVGKVSKDVLQKLYERKYIDIDKKITDAGRAALASAASDGEGGAT